MIILSSLLLCKLAAVISCAVFTSIMNSGISLFTSPTLTLKLQVASDTWGITDLRFTVTTVTITVAVTVIVIVYCYRRTSGLPIDGL